MKRLKKIVLFLISSSLILLGLSSGAFAADDALHGITTSSVSIFEESGFSDVFLTSWFFLPVKDISARKVMNGYGDGTFRPNNSMTRAEAVTVLANSFGGSLGNTSNTPFNDISGHWARNQIVWAYNEDIIGGTGNGNFSPNALVTRQDFAVMVGRYCRYAEYYFLPTFTNISYFADDSAIASYARSYVYALQQARVISGGQNNCFFPTSTITRAETTKIMYGVIQLFRSDNFPLINTQIGYIKLNSDVAFSTPCYSQVSIHYRNSGNYVTFYETDSFLAVDTNLPEHDEIVFFPFSRARTTPIYYNNNSAPLTERYLSSDTRMATVTNGMPFYNLTYYPAHKYSYKGDYRILMYPSIETWDHSTLKSWIKFEHICRYQFN